jgi:hypothetical protein
MEYLYIEQENKKKELYNIYILDKQKFFDELFKIIYQYETVESLLSSFDFILEEDFEEVNYIYKNGG